MGQLMEYLLKMANHLSQELEELGKTESSVLDSNTC